MSNSNTRIRKSERLSKDEVKALKTYRKGYETMLDFSEDVGIARQTLDRVFQIGSGSEITVNAIRGYLAKKEREKEEAAQM